MQRAFDMVIALAFCLILSPLIAAIAAVVKLQDGGPVFHTGRRVGKDGKMIGVLKFRTMVPGAEKMGPAITASGDPRITRLGRLLRKTKLDELPQFLNVLKGDMSLVGPRPEDPRYVAVYSLEQRKVLSVRPGITSPASLAYSDEESLLSGDAWEARYLTEILPRKLEIEAAYLRRRTILSDIAVLFKTLARVLS